MSESRALSVIAGSPETALKFIEVVAESLHVGDGTPPERKSAAMIVATQMIAEEKTLAEIRQKYHIYVDKLDYRAEWVHAELERRGWDWDWEKDGEDREEAVFVATKNGKTRRASFSMDQAKRKGLVKPQSNWMKDPAEMLRARAITRFATMWVPSIGAGVQSDTDATARVEVDVRQTDDSDEASLTSQVISSTVTVRPTTVSRESPISSIDFPKRAVTAFAKQPTLSTIGNVCSLTYKELVAREGMGKGTADKVVELLEEHGLALAVVGADGDEGSGNEPVKEESHGSAEADVSAHTANSTKPADNSQHGQAIAEIRELCNRNVKLKEVAIEQIAVLWPGKTSLHDLDSVETHLLLVRLLAHEVGVSDKFPKVMETILADPHPVDRAIANIKQLQTRTKN